MKHSARNLALAFAAAALMLFQGTPSSAEGNSQLEVKCLDQSGNPVSNVKVVLQHMEAGKTKDKKSDAKGIALFTKLEDGSYRIIGRRDGMAPAFSEFSILRGGAQQSVTLKFEPGSPETKLYFEDPVLARKADEFMAQARGALQAGKLPEAVSLFQESLRVNPTNPEAYFYIATCYVQQQKWDEAIEAYNRTAAMVQMVRQLPRPEGAGGADPLAQLEEFATNNAKKVPVFRVQTEAEELNKARKFEEAAAKYQEALKLSPADSYLYYALAVTQYNARQPALAEQAIDKAIELKPGEKVYIELKKQVEQVKETERLLQAKVLLDAGDKQYNSGDYSGALKKYEEARPLLPEKNLPGLLVQLGRTYGKLKDADKALAHFSKAIEMAPDNADYRRALAQYYLNEKKYEEALNIFLDPRASSNATPDQALFELGQKLSNTGDSEVAELAFEKVLKINQDHADASYELGMLLYFSKKDDKRAIELLTKYTRLAKAQDKIDNAKSVLAVLKKRAGKS